MSSTDQNETMSVKDKALIKRHDEMVNAILLVTKDMIDTGLKSWGCTFFNDFKVTITDNKSAKFRENQKKSLVNKNTQQYAEKKK